MTYHFDFASVFALWPELLRGCWLTLWLSAVSITAGLAIGLLTVLAKRSTLIGLPWIATTYVEVTRNTPFLIQVLFIYLGLPSIGVNLTPWMAAFVALSLNCGAFSGEIMRSGIDAVSRGQSEAGAALGLGPLQVFRYVVLKPAMRTIFPALSGQFILVMLTSSIVSSISAEELTSAAQQVDTQTYRSFEVYIVTTLLYLGMALLMSFAFRGVSRALFSYPTK